MAAYAVAPTPDRIWSNTPGIRSLKETGKVAADVLQMKVARFYYRDGRMHEQEIADSEPDSYLQRPEIDGELYIQHSFRKRPGEQRDAEIVNYDEMTCG